jgi:hypothetical protein
MGRSKAAAAAAAEGDVSARVLVAYDFDGVMVQPNDVVQCSPEFAAAHAGVLDATPEAVEYALSEDGGGKRVDLTKTVEPDEQ